MAKFLPSVLSFQFLEDAHEAARAVALKVSSDIALGRIPHSSWDEFDAELDQFFAAAIQLLPSTKMHRPMPRSGLAKYISPLPYAQYPAFSIPSPAPVPPRPPKLPIETTWGEIEAFRVWRVFDHQARLFSSYTDHEWKPREVMAAHKKPRDNDDGINAINFDRTGVHAWKSMVEVVEHGQAILNNMENRPHKHRALAFGRVKLWGEVVEHQRGYRAEFAKIVGIDDLVEIETIKDYDMRTDRYIQSHHSKWLGEDLEVMRARYFPERVRKQPNA